MSNIQNQDTEARGELRDVQHDGESVHSGETLAQPTHMLERQMTGAGEASKEVDTHQAPDELVVDWDGANDPLNPKKYVSGFQTLE